MRLTPRDQKISLRSRLEMRNCSHTSRQTAMQPRKTVLQKENSLKQMPRSTTTSTTKMTRMRLTPREKPRLPVTTTCQDRPRSPLSSEPEVSTSSLPNARRSCSYSVSVKSTTVSLSVLTVPLSTWSEQSSHLSLTDTHPVIMSAV